MKLKVKFIFITDLFIMIRRAGGRRGAGLPIALALAFVFAFGAAPAAWAQSQDAAPSAQTGAPAATDAGDPSGAPDDATPDPETMFPHFKSTRFWLSGQANFIFQ